MLPNNPCLLILIWLSKNLPIMLVLYQHNCPKLCWHIGLVPTECIVPGPGFLTSFLSFHTGDQSGSVAHHHGHHPS